MSKFRTGNGTAWLDLLASLIHRWRDVQIETLDSPDSLRAWFAENDIEPVEDVTEADVELVKTTREALHRVTSAVVGGVRPDHADIEVLQDAVNLDVPPQLKLTANRPATTPPRTAEHALGRLVRAAIAVLTSEDAKYLKHCGDNTCSSIFLDYTGRRRWCTDLSCGNRARVRAYRAKNA